MSLSLDVYSKKKQNTKTKKKQLDRRNFKGGRNKEENLIDELHKEIDNILPGANKQTITTHLLKLKEKLKYLNFYLLLNVYYYFSKKNFDLSIVFIDFDNDYKEEFKNIMEDNPYTSDLKTPLTMHKFRQDYIMYLFLLDGLNLNQLYENNEEDIIDVEEDNYLADKEDFGEIDYDEVIEDEYQQDY